MDDSSTAVLQGISLLDGAIQVLYLLGLTAIALYHSRKMRSQEDYFLAGRSMSQWPIAFSMFVALFSTNSFLGVTGWVNRAEGTVWIGLQNLGIILVVPAVIALYPKIFFRLRLTTAYEYLERRFDYRVRAFAALFFMAARVMWMSSMIYAASLMITAMLGWSSQGGGLLGAILLVGIVGMLFAMAGGMHSVIWTDVVQFFVIFGGVAVMVVTAVTKVGGVGKAVEIAAAAGKWTPPPLFDPTQELTIVSGLCLGVVGYLSSAGSDQVVLQTDSEHGHVPLCRGPAGAADPPSQRAGRAAGRGGRFLRYRHGSPVAKIEPDAGGRRVESFPSSGGPGGFPQPGFHFLLRDAGRDRHRAPGGTAQPDLRAATAAEGGGTLPCGAGRGFRCRVD